MSPSARSGSVDSQDRPPWQPGGQAQGTGTVPKFTAASSRSTDNLLAADRVEVTDAKVMRSTTAMLPSAPLGRTQRGRRKRCSDGVVQDLNDLDW
jgi:hypothetical protein